MTRRLRIVLADDERTMLEFLQQSLLALGHEVVGTARTGRELVERCLTLQPDLAITDIKMPELDGLEAAAEIYRQHPLPIIIISAHHDPELIARAGQNHAGAYLVKPIKQADLQPAIGMAIQRFEQFQTLLGEAASLRQALEDRKIIERAKGILMKRAGLDEEKAFRRLQQLASEKHRKMSEIAQLLVTADEAFQSPEDV